MRAARYRLPILLGALLAATLFRALPLTDNGFHPDEALYAYFARLIAGGRNPLLAGLVVDKPPLPFYLNALSLALIGPTPFAARLPTFFAGLISVTVLYRLARRLYGPRVAHLAAWLLALSPFAILFSITLFLDPLLTVFVLWGWWMCAEKRARVAALAFALAFAVKQTALFFIPLGVALVLTHLPQQAQWRDAAREVWRLARPMVFGLMIVFAFTLAWDAARQPPVGVWTQGYADNAPNRLIRAGEVLPRATAWLELLSYIAASPSLNALLIIGLPALLLVKRRAPSRPALIDLLFTGFCSLYLAVYWLFAFNVWDRYLVPLVPLVLILLARVASVIADKLFTRHLSPATLPLAATTVALCLLLLPSAVTASRSGYPIGGDHGAYDGIEEMARYLNTLPSGTVLYDFWLSWQWSFYLFDGPVYVAWMPSPEVFATDLRSFGISSPRYLVVPVWEADTEARAAAESAGVTFVLEHTVYRRDGVASFHLYRLSPSP